jgi:bifunctional UDP-N-acetylglucosamine pyrophosphorylase/glucosamine-1-phosphate N-acetyltransferase
MKSNKIIILAGGKGTRMKTEIPKVLTQVKGKTLISYLLKNVEEVYAEPSFIIGYKGEEVIEATENKYHYIWQRQQLGTGHAISCAKDQLENKGYKNIMVVPGDQPLISGKTLKMALDHHKDNESVITLITAEVPNYEGDFANYYNCGRIVKDDNGKVEKIVELKDASDECKEINEVNLSCYCFNADWLWSNIGSLKNNNKAQEYYLTDLIEMAVEQKRAVHSISLIDPIEGLGVNSMEQLEIVEKYV